MNMAGISDFPDEILLKIFSYLSIADLNYSILHVCKSWKDIAEDERLWLNVHACITLRLRFRQVRLEDFSLLMNSLDRRGIDCLAFEAYSTTEVGDVLRVAPRTLLDRVTCLIINIFGADSDNPTGLGIRSILRFFPNLKELTCKGKQVSFEEIKALHNQNVFRLQKLSFQRSVFISRVLLGSRSMYPEDEFYAYPRTLLQYDEAIIQLILRVDKLTTLSLSRNTVLSGELLEKLFHACSHLKHIDLSHTAIVDDDVLPICVDEIPSNTLRSINLNNCKKLRGSIGILIEKHRESLEVLQVEEIELSVNTIRSISQLQRIYRLNLRKCRSLSDQYIQVLKPALKSCLSLSLNSCFDLKKTALLHLTAGERSLGTLTDINLGHCTSLDDDCLQKVCVCCAALEHLDISSCTLITDAGIQSVFKYLHGLKTLAIKWCINISDLGLSGCVNQESRLEEKPSERSRELMGSKNMMSHEGASIKTSNLKRLQKLDISFCSKITDVTCNVIKEISSLISLDISGLRLVSDIGIESLVTSLVSLEHLSIGSCSKITDSVLIKIIQKLLRLRTLDVSKRFTVESIQKILVYCQQLNLNIIIDGSVWSKYYFKCTILNRSYPNVTVLGSDDTHVS